MDRVETETDVAKLSASLHDAAIVFDGIHLDETARILSIPLWIEDRTQPECVRKCLLLLRLSHYPRQRAVLTVHHVSGIKFLGSMRVTTPLVFGISWNEQNGVLRFDTGRLADFEVTVEALAGSLEMLNEYSQDDFGLQRVSWPWSR